MELRNQDITLELRTLHSGTGFVMSLWRCRLACAMINMGPQIRHFADNFPSRLLPITMGPRLAGETLETLKLLDSSPTPKT